MKHITLISILVLLFFFGCTTTKLVYIHFQAHDFQLTKIKNRSIVIYSTNNVDIRQFKKTFVKEYGTSDIFLKKISFTMKSKLSEVYPEARIRIDTTEALDFMLGEISFSEDSQKKARDFFSNLNEDYLFVAKKALITNSYSRQGTYEQCIVVLEFEIWDVNNKSKVLNFRAVGSTDKNLFFSGIALKSSVNKAIDIAVKYIKQNGKGTIITRSTQRGDTTKGTVSGGRYQSPLNNFIIELPNWPGLKIQDQTDNEGGRVSFHGDFGSLWALTYLRLPANSDSTFKDNEKRDSTYSNFLKTFAVPSLFSPASQGTRIVHEEFLGERENRAYFAVVSTPEGSALVDLLQNKRFDSVRGLLIFHKRGFMYMVESEMNSIFSTVVDSSSLDPSSLDPQQLESSQSTLKRLKDSVVFK